MAGATGLSAVFQRWISPTNLAMIYLLAVVISAVFLGRGPSILASLLGVLAFDFFENEPIIEVNKLKIDLARRQVTVAGVEISLTPTEYDILRLLAQNSGKVLTHRQLLQNVWGHAYGEDLYLLRVNISNLRRKIEPDSTRPYYIQTEPGVGYRLRSEV